MRKVFSILFFCAVSFASSFAQKDTVADVKYFSTLSHISIRALQSLNDSTVWFAADHGVWGFTADAGRTWHIDSLKADTVYPDFRSIAVLNDSIVLLLGAASPAYLFKTINKGRTWKLAYKNADKDIFFDCMKFRDVTNGFAIGDPIEGCVQVISTKNGGESWQQLACGNIPKTAEGESLFATSNSNLDIFKNNVWFVTGGKGSHVFHSTDAGYHFEKYNAPEIQFGKIAGFVSLDFINDKTGLISGGDYDKTDLSIVSLAFTNDGGKTWTPIQSSKAFFGSCVKFRNANSFFVTGHDGTYFGDLKVKAFSEIKDKLGAQLKFHRPSISPSGKSIWLAGGNGKIALIKFNVR